MGSRALDQFRTVLDHLDGEDRRHQLSFFRFLLATGPEAVPELDGRLPGSRAPRALRQLAMEGSFYFPWPEWVPILARMLRYELDHTIFETGARALGRIGNAQALDALRELNTLRQQPEFKDVVAGVLTRTDPLEAFDHYLSRLLEGSANPTVANEAAQHLTGLVDGDKLASLRTLTMHPDLLVFRHAVLLVAAIPTAEAAVALRDILEDSHRETLADRSLKEVLTLFRNLAPPAAREKAQDALRAAASGEGQERSAALAAFYREVVAATDEPRATALPAALAQAMEALHNRARRLAFATDACAEGLATLVQGGLAEPGPVLALLVEVFREQTGREGVARALARLVPVDAAEIQDLILGAPDVSQRAAAVEVLGGRREEDLRPVLLKACRDPLADIADRAVHHLADLPGAEAMAREILQSADPQDITLALALVKEGGLRALVPDLLDKVSSETREETALQIIATLGALGGELARVQLLDMLHSGQSLRMQTLVAESLRDLGNPETALALCAKAEELKTPLLHGVALEALGRAFHGPERALSAENGTLVLHHVDRAWADRNPWALRVRVVTALLGLHLSSPETWALLGDRLREALSDKRPAGAWSPDTVHAVQAALREFTRRANGEEPDSGSAPDGA